jgi:hypothetical protein
MGCAALCTGLEALVASPTPDQNALSACLVASAALKTILTDASGISRPDPELRKA